jgi:perosamine synthetase
MRVEKMIPWGKPTLVGKEKVYVLDALDSTWLSGGAYVERIETDFPRRCGARYGVSACNGTMAIHLALAALGVGPGDEVIVPGFTFVATGNAVMYAGAKPVFADIDRRSWLLDVSSAERCVSPATRGVIVPHLFGNVADMDAVMDFADRRELWVVEDVAQAAFSTYKGRHAGTFGALGTFSFQATKTITCGEGGMVLTDNESLRDRMVLLRDHGMQRDRKYWHEAVGYNYRLTNVQAAIACAQLECVDAIISERRRVHRAFHEQLSGLEGIELQQVPECVEQVPWAFPVRIDPERVCIDRDEVIRRLAEVNVETRPAFYPFSVLPLYDCPSLPVAEAVGLHGLTLPLYPSLTQGEIEYIGAQFKLILQRSRK